MDEIEPSQTESSRALIFNCEGRDIPFEVAGPHPDEIDEFLDAVAEFLLIVKN